MHLFRLFLVHPNIDVEVTSVVIPIESGVWVLLSERTCQSDMVDGREVVSVLVRVPAILSSSIRPPHSLRRGTTRSPKGRSKVALGERTQSNPMFDVGG